MSAHAFWATSGCQSLSFVGESVSHHASTPPKRRATTPILRQNGLTNMSAIANAIARSPATTLFALPNGASNHTAPNAQAIAMIAVRRTSSSPTQRMTRTRSFIMGITTHACSKTLATRLTSSTFGSFNFCYKWFHNSFSPNCRASVSDACLGHVDWRFTETPYRSVLETAVPDEASPSTATPVG